MKYYFITYQATNNQGLKSTWNDVTDKSPMKFIKDVQSVEELANGTYHGFVVLNTLEISEEEYKEFKCQF